jgi:hypothetical protein
MPSILFDLAEVRAARGRLLGVGPSLAGFLPLPATKLRITGVTKDSAGTILGGCEVTLHRTVDHYPLETITSNPVTGAYEFSTVGLAQNYYVVSYKAGSPDVSGASVNTLIGA